MADSLRHRGPDSCGAWIDPAAGLALGHRRLAIIDLSAKGDQPMVSNSGRYCIVFNGEIYNHPRLRRELLIQGAELRGHSDTEVLLMAVETWAWRPPCMPWWACSHLHCGTGTRVRSRWRVTIWGKSRCISGTSARPSRSPRSSRRSSPTRTFEGRCIAARSHFMRHQYLPAPHTIWRDVFKLPAGCLLSLDLAHGGPAGVDLIARIERHWCMRTIAEQGRSAPAGLSNRAALDRLDQLLNEAVRDCMVAEVPLGAFLSGGIDSSLLVALMQRHAARPINTFTIGFAEAPFDEAAHARQVARHLGTAHTELYVTAAEARAIIPQLPDMFDEPLADPSQIPTFQVAQLARQQVTGCLSGDGGDEVFGGCGRYVLAERLRRRRTAVPRRWRHAAAALAHALPSTTWDLMLRPPA